MELQWVGPEAGWVRQVTKIIIMYTLVSLGGRALDRT